MAMLIIGILVGVMVGLIYPVQVLVPLTLGTLLFCCEIATWGGHSVAEALVSAVLSLIALQGGYMIGLTGRDPYYQS